MAGEAGSVKWFGGSSRVTQDRAYKTSMKAAAKSERTLCWIGISIKLQTASAFAPGQTPQATKPWAVCKGQTTWKANPATRAIGTSTLEFLQGTEESKDFPSYHTCVRPWWSHLVYAGTTLRYCWSTKSCASLDGWAPQSTGYQLKCCRILSINSWHGFKHLDVQFGITDLGWLLPISRQEPIPRRVL